MKALLVAIDAKYIQTNLAVRSLASYYKKATGKVLPFAEYTINHSTGSILDSLYHHAADVYLFSTYIWNIELIKELITDLHKIRPEARIFLGGPEATYHATAILREYPAVGGILTGEGEATVVALLALLADEKEIGSCKGIFLNTGHTGIRTPLSMDSLPFAYEDLDALEHRILYYESMRGCPFQCSYCLSSVEQGVRFRSLDLVLADLSRFLAEKVRQVKFVDRTFNCKKSHAMAIWEFLREKDNGITNFHFELAGELIDQETLEFLATLRPGLVQFEIGVQSTYPQTLEAIQRPWAFEALAERVRTLQAPGNIHLHLDLIAGLPHEDFLRFQTSFNDVYSLAPHQLQLGFLKVLGGSKMEADAPSLALKYQTHAPYEVLETRWISFEELSLLHGVDDMVDHYYNSGRYQHTLEYLLRDENPFAFYLALAQYFKQSVGNRPLSKLGYYELLGEFQLHRGEKVTEELMWCCKYDMLLHESLPRFPRWITVDLAPTHREFIRRFFRSDEMIGQYLPQYNGKNGEYISKRASLEIFPTCAGAPWCPPGDNAEQAIAVLFDYDKRNILGNATVSLIKMA